MCVTGLVVVDTGTYWSTFGQAVLLALFQIGGLGFIVGATLLLLAISRRFGLKERLAVSEAMGSDQIGGVLSLVIKIAIFSLIVEAIGTVIFYFNSLAVDRPEISLWAAVFHAISAFNNCGMDLMGNFQSLAGYQGDAVMLLTTAGLVIVGSTGYVVIMDLFRHGRFIKLSLDSKIVLVTTFVLLVIGTLFYLGVEYSNAATLGPLSFPQKILGAFFQSVSPRTAGFTSIDIGSLSQIALLFTMVLMFIGGAAGSTAGGLKVNTLGVLWITILSIVKGRSNVEAFGRQISQRIINRSLALFSIFLVMVSLVVLALSLTETFPIENIMFEALSALSTVGLSTGITPDLSIAGRIIIIITMFIGRLGPLALMAFLVRRQQVSEIDYPHESVRLG